jgi:hypothetical protein
LRGFCAIAPRAPSFVSDKSQLAKIREVRDSLPDLQHVITMDALEGDDILHFANVEQEGTKYLESTRTPGRRCGPPRSQTTWRRSSTPAERQATPRA